MENWEKYKSALNSLLKSGESLNTEKRIKAAAIINTFLTEEFGIEAILVGGLATEVYTEGGYRTRDIDMVSTGQNAYNALIQLGFSVSKGGMVAQLTYRNSGLFIEFPSSQLEDADKKRVANVVVSEDYYFKIIGLEDLLLDRIRGILYHGRTENQEAVIRMIIKQRNNIDWSYLLKNLTDSSELETFNYLYHLSESPQNMDLNELVEKQRIKRNITVPASFMISRALNEQILMFLLSRKSEVVAWYALFVEYDDSISLTESKTKKTFADLSDIFSVFIDFEDELITKEQLAEELYGFLVRKFNNYLGIVVN